MCMIRDYFTEISKSLLEDEKPSHFLNTISREARFKEHPFDMLYILKETPQSPVHHPEGSVWNHTLMVVDEAAKRRESCEEKRAFMWAALLHDIGKGPTTKLRKGRITSYDHDRVGMELAESFLKTLTDDSDFIKRVAVIVRWHMQPLFVVKDLPFAKLLDMLEDIKLEEIALFSLCDRLGRGNMDSRKAEEEIHSIETFKDKCRELLVHH
ncbi:MAG: HDIG domain-containing protein [Bacillota bacterium]|nr:HDIG domain-containing protein [Bacillota bacterium]